MAAVLKAPPGWDRVLAAADRFAPRLQRAVLEWAESVQMSLSVDAIVDAINNGKAAELVAQAVRAAQTAAALAVYQDMLTAASRVAAGLVANEAGPTMPGQLGPAEGAWYTQYEAGPLRVDFAAVDQTAADYAAQLWRDDWANITDETQRAIRALMGRAPVEGISVYEQARMLRSMIGLDERQAAGYANRLAQLTRQLPSMRGPARARAEARLERWLQQQLRVRAERIARTESLMASRWSQHQSWQQAQTQGLLDAGALQRWSATAGACDLCQSLDGQTWPISEQPWVFTHPNCRCSMVLVV